MWAPESNGAVYHGQPRVDAFVSDYISPRIALLGPGRSGKDTAGGWLGLFTPLRYVGSTSRVVLPLIAAELQQPVDVVWRERHQRRMYWKNWADEYRRDDPTKIARKCLETGDIVVGLRAVEELNACKEAKLFDLIVWVENPRVSVDPTVTFTKEDCDILVRNEGELSVFYTRLHRLCDFARIPVRPIASCWGNLPTLNANGDWVGPLVKCAAQVWDSETV